MEFNYITITLEDLKLKSRYAEKIRGYLGNKYEELDLLHNHNNEKFIYRYPLVQYKIINGKPMFVGINEGCHLISKILLNEDSFILDNKKIEYCQTNIQSKRERILLEDHYIKYKFLTPWIGLNQKNSKIYRKLNSVEKEELLKKILIGNVLSLSKNLGYTIKEKIYCSCNLKETNIKLKNISHIGFIGEFKINFKIPDYLGIGKSVSRGFGTIKNIE